jgi:hypothetical protein
MKKLCSITVIAVFFLLCTIGIQAQTTQTQLNQVELGKQFIGSWKCDVAKDTTYTTELTSFGNVGALEQSWKSITKGKILNEFKYLYGYDKKSDKYIVAQIVKSYAGINLTVIWFTSKSKCEVIPFEYLSNPEKATTKWEYELKSPDLMTYTAIENSKPVWTLTYTRVKN